jgi:hypothetical protein
VPFSRENFTENARARERMRLRLIAMQEELRRHERIHNRGRLKLYAIVSILTLLFLCAGLVGLFYFAHLSQGVSVVPECSSAASMMASLYSCCAFWFLCALVYARDRSCPTTPAISYRGFFLHRQEKRAFCPWCRGALAQPSVFPKVRFQAPTKKNRRRQIQEKGLLRNEARVVERGGCESATLQCASE